MPNFTHKRKSVSRLMAPVALAIVLAGCSAPNPYNQAPLIDITAAAVQSSTAYLNKAQVSDGNERVNWEILALKAMIEEGKWQQADLLVTNLSQQSMNPLQIAEWQLARAAVRTHQGEYQDALNSLNFQPSWQLTKKQYQRYYTLRAELLDQLNHQFQAARERSKLDFYLEHSQKAANWNNVWHDLSGYSNTQLSNVKISSDEEVFKGWVELAMLRNNAPRQNGQLKAAIEQWLSLHPYHPANQFFPEDLEATMNMKAIKLDNVALLLPLSGRFAAQGKTVRDGFVNAMMDNASHDADTELNIYDTEAESMASIMAKIHQNGTQFVVGPLRKDKIVEFQNNNTTDINALALNLPPSIDANHPSTCYFALSPEQEAEQAAEHIFQDGQKKPVVLVPDSPYGQRISEAFQQAWSALSIDPAYIATFNARQKNMPQQIGQVFGHAPGSQSDAIYIVASRKELLTIKPFIESALPASEAQPQIYVSSRSYPDRKDSASEILGLKIGDIPLLIDPPANYMERFNQLWPNEGNTSLRLHAFGMDAYLLSNELPQMRTMSDYTTQGATGVLRANGQCVIQREIDWGKFTTRGIQPE